MADFRTCTPFAQKDEWCWLTKLQDVADIKEPSEACAIRGSNILWNILTCAVG
ncbi:MAG: hypothetical protein IIV20_09575 [Bacteroidaceae bacterium]|nr:hypothetical protein [Bacteroidaceae bacterium]